ncbi:MAG TPA: hypothetical protein VJP78_04770 [Thermoleophilia bacterium]|nr:hypothetical protein [Thermoleophilia bacterium]
MLKNVTLSADERLITLARGEAQRRGTTLNAEFRLWLEAFISQEKVASDYQALMARLSYAHPNGDFTREELNER